MKKILPLSESGKIVILAGIGTSHLFNAKQIYSLFFSN